MGLDTVEIVIWAEKEFQVEMPDSEVFNIYTVGEFAKYIAMKVNEKHGTNITYEHVLPKLIDVIVKDYGVPRNKINTTSRFVDDLGFN